MVSKYTVKRVSLTSAAACKGAPDAVLARIAFNDACHDRLVTRRTCKRKLEALTVGLGLGVNLEAVGAGEEVHGETPKHPP
eukprot:3885022-Rhodomonas_salina.1